MRDKEETELALLLGNMSRCGFPWCRWQVVKYDMLMVQNQYYLNNIE